MPDTALEEMLDILVVDDSPTYRMILSRTVRGWTRGNLVGSAGDGEAALAAIEAKHPDLVLLDVSMPVLDGIETLKRIRTRHVDVDVIMFSGLDESQTGLTMQALSLGAIDFVPKPQGDNPSESFSTLSANLYPLLDLAWGRRKRRQARIAAAKVPALVLRTRPPVEATPTPQAPAPGQPKSAAPLAQVQPVAAPQIQPKPEVSRPAGEAARSPEKPPVRIEPARTAVASGTRMPIQRIELVVVGVSTGGPNALHVLVPKLPKDFPVPIVCVQHMPPLFTASLAERLDRDSAISVVEGGDGQVLEAGRLYIAPGGRHMVVGRGVDNRMRISLRDDPPVHSCRPSVDVLFRSVAEICQGTVVSVVLTGMGSDGAEGVGLLRSRGSWSLIQDEASSVVWGMPGAVHSAGQADEVLPLESIAPRLTEIVTRKGARP